MELFLSVWMVPTMLLGAWITGNLLERRHLKGLRLLDFQIRAIEAIRSGDNVLVSAPTGAGKTLVAEYAIADAVARGRRCIYTAPIKALSNQKYRDFRDDPSIDVGLMTGDVTIHPGAQVLIMTTEILRNTIFENPGGLGEIDYVIPLAYDGASEGERLRWTIPFGGAWSDTIEQVTLVFDERWRSWLSSSVHDRREGSSRARGHGQPLGPPHKLYLLHRTSCAESRRSTKDRFSDR